MSIWCSETILRGKKLRASLEQLPPAVFGFPKIGYLGLGGLFRARVAVLLKLSPKMEPPRTQLRIQRIQPIHRKWDTAGSSDPRFLTCPRAG